jgi:hypothetical protein
MNLTWQVYNGGCVITAVITKYSVSKNPSTGLYYRLHILNVGVSDLKEA